MNSEYQYQELTGRTPDMQPIENSLIQFNENAPFTTINCEFLENMTHFGVLVLEIA